MNNSNLIYIFKALLLFLLISFVLDKACFFVFNKISDQVYTGQSIGKINQYLEIKDTTDLFIFGSSRANHHVNPEVFKKSAYNVGQDGRKIGFSSTILKVLPKDKKQTILFHIDPVNAYDVDYKPSDADALLVKYNRNQVITQSLDELKRSNKFQKFYWSINYNSKVVGILKNFLKPSYNYKKYDGYDPIVPSDTQINFFRETIDFEIRCFDNVNMNQYYELLIPQIINFCNENNKDLFFFTSPMYRDNCRVDNKAMNKYMNDLGVNYLDFTDLFVEDNQFDYWKDLEHLSSKGADIFSEQLKTEMENVLVNQ